MRLRYILFAVVAIVSFSVSLWVMDWLSPSGPSNGPRLTDIQPLPPAARSSTVIAPIAIALSAIRDAVDHVAPHSFTGTGDNPAAKVLSQADIGWSVARGAMTATGTANGLTLSSPLNGTLNVTGALSGVAGNVGGSIGGLLNSSLGKQIEGLTSKTFSAKADIQGNVAVTARPAILANWRIEPNLSAQVSVGDTGVSAGGLRLGVPAQVKPLLDRMVNEQVATLQARVRNDPTLEQIARREWAKMCRSIPLPGASAGLPDLWLELRPTKAIAAQPRIDASNVTLTIGVEAETRVLAAETKPSCPFPATLDLVTPQPGRLAIGVPIDIPFTTVNTILETQIKGRTFPEDGSGSVDVTVKSASVAPSGDRLLISLLVNAKEKKSFIGFGADATIHIWGRPVLDQQQQILRLTDIQLAVESEAAFGLLGAAARAAMPYLQAALADKAVVDLKPFAANARAKISAALADFQRNEQGVHANTAITNVRLTDIAFDAKTLRVIADLEGTVDVALSQLPAQ